jgi:hypothetical protein
VCERLSDSIGDLDLLFYPVDGFLRKKASIATAPLLDVEKGRF